MRSARLGLDMLRAQTVGRALRRQRRFIFLSNPIDGTGAPKVLLRSVEEFCEKYGSHRVVVVAPEVHARQREDLELIGVRIEKAAEMEPALVRMQLPLSHDDFVLVNTVAVYENYQRYVIDLLQTGRLERAFWFIHEDIDQLAIAGPLFLEAGLRAVVARLVESNRLIVAVPSEKLRRDYNGLFETDRVKTISLRLGVDERYKQARDSDDFDTVRFLLSGTATDGRKGQLIALFAFAEFLNRYQAANPSAYRPFSLHLVSIGDDDVSRQIRVIGKDGLGDRLVLHATVPYDEALQISHACNAVVCCSLNEGFALYVAEAMAMSHVLFRNDAGGMEEQLEDGVNGWRIETDDIVQFAAVVERALNRHKTSNEALREMGQASADRIRPYETQSYLEQLEIIDGEAGDRS